MPRESVVVLLLGETGVTGNPQPVRLSDHTPNTHALMTGIEPGSPWREASALTNVQTGHLFYGFALKYGFLIMHLKTLILSFVLLFRIEIVGNTKRAVTG